MNWTACCASPTHGGIEEYVGRQIKARRFVYIELVNIVANSVFINSVSRVSKQYIYNSWQNSAQTRSKQWLNSADHFMWVVNSGRGRGSVSGLHFIPARTYDYTYVYRSNPMQVVVADHHPCSKLARGRLHWLKKPIPPDEMVQCIINPFHKFSGMNLFLVLLLVII